MEKYSLLSKKEKDDKFSKIGKKQIKHIKSEPEPLVIRKKILYDKKTQQFSCKFPKKIMENLESKGKEELEFTLVFPKDMSKEPELKIKYIKK